MSDVKAQNKTVKALAEKAHLEDDTVANGMYVLAVGSDAVDKESGNDTDTHGTYRWPEAWCAVRCLRANGRSTTALMARRPRALIARRTVALHESCVCDCGIHNVQCQRRRYNIECCSGRWTPSRSSRQVRPRPPAVVERVLRRSSVPITLWCVAKRQTSPRVSVYETMCGHCGKEWVELCVELMKW